MFLNSMDYILQEVSLIAQVVARAVEEIKVILCIIYGKT